MNNTEMTVMNIHVYHTDIFLTFSHWDVHINLILMS